MIWAKPRFVISRGDYHWQHEPCWYAVRKGKPHRWSGDRSQATLWPIAHQKSDTGHGTQKPIECMRRPIENNSKAGDAVYDPFVGSGTSIIAAEMTRRRCLAIDVDPKYVDVAVERWAKFTGREPILEATGQTFAEVQDARYDKDADLSGSVADSLAAVCARKATGGPGWPREASEGAAGNGAQAPAAAPARRSPKGKAAQRGRAAGADAGKAAG